MYCGILVTKYLDSFVSVKVRQLPIIEEAWNLPISADMASRAQNFKPEPQSMKKFKVEAVEKIHDE